MYTIRKLTKTEIEYASIIANLHISAFPNFFLTQLGKTFLCALYRGYIEDDNSGIIVAEDSCLLGFIAYSNDYSAFFKNLIKRHLLVFGWCSLCAVLRHPTYIKRLFRAFKKSELVEKPDLYVELASICVRPGQENRGIGTRLIEYMKDNTDFEKYSFINLETDADNNDSVNTFYIKNGFELAQQYVTPEGRRMNEYRYFKR